MGAEWWGTTVLRRMADAHRDGSMERDALLRAIMRHGDMADAIAALRAEVERLRGLLRWVYEHRGEGWAEVCDEEVEIAALAEGAEDE